MDFTWLGSILRYDESATPGGHGSYVRPQSGRYMHISTTYDHIHDRALVRPARAKCRRARPVRRSTITFGHAFCTKNYQTVLPNRSYREPNPPQGKNRFIEESSGTSSSLYNMMQAHIAIHEAHTYMHVGSHTCKHAAGGKEGRFHEVPLNIWARKLWTILNAKKHQNCDIFNNP